MISCMQQSNTSVSPLAASGSTLKVNRLPIVPQATWLCSLGSSSLCSCLSDWALETVLLWQSFTAHFLLMQDWGCKDDSNYQSQAFEGQVCGLFTVPSKQYVSGLFSPSFRWEQPYPKISRYSNFFYLIFNTRLLQGENLIWFQEQKHQVFHILTFSNLFSQGLVGVFQLLLGTV